MNENIAKGKWSAMKGKAKKKWGNLTSNKLMVISGEKEKMVGRLQAKYGHARDKAENTHKKFTDRKNK